MAGAVFLAVVLVGVTIAILTADDTLSVASAEQCQEAFPLVGRITLTDSDGIAVNGGTCAGRGGYDDIGTGAGVTV